ncbi:MAG: hypothetical protein ACK5NT_00925 [Pyrinomonadaceae bacterium]
MRAFIARFPSISILLFRRTNKNGEDFVKERVHERLNFKEKRIRCPKCNWQPQSGSFWVCSNCAEPEHFFGGCGTRWNTFDTGGICPGCDHKWRWTICLQCMGWSRHKSWYEYEK